MTGNKRRKSFKVGPEATPYDGYTAEELSALRDAVRALGRFMPNADENAIVGRADAYDALLDHLESVENPRCKECGQRV